MTNIRNLTGLIFGKLTVLRLEHTNGGWAHWKCICSCGTKKIVCGGDLTSRHTLSCGCYRRENTSKCKKGNNYGHKHGMSYGPIYWVWYNMISRCTNPKATGYENYGGRGIKVCKRWLAMINFRDDMYAAYLEHKAINSTTTLERKDNDGNYCPSNCRWATRKEQQANTRRKRRILL